MKIRGYSFKCEDPFFVYFKKHYCPYCGQKLIRKKESQIIHYENLSFNAPYIFINLSGLRRSGIQVNGRSCQRIFVLPLP
jgi:hypothetical protein